MSRKAVILAGGLGSRLAPFTKAIPKPLMPIGERAVLDIQIEQLSNYGFTDVYLATNYKSDYIERFFAGGDSYGVSLHFSKEEEPLGTIGPLSLLREELSDQPFLVMNGDILSQADLGKLYSYACKSDAALTVGIRKQSFPFDFGNVSFEGDYVTAVVEKPNIETYILCGMYVLKPEILSLIPDNTYFGIDTLIHEMLAKQMPITKYEITEYWLDIGRREDYQKAQVFYENLE